ncbi:MAG: type II toxin-antitoxin system RelE/ParE family toxin [Candidatus Algichlamydia australiensis]|nr:type II toxin-antitoxin system RelE/ParE family toxin [Chlamydiales bacterium]
MDKLVRTGKLDRNDFDDLLRIIITNPDEGDVMRGTGGLRKIRLKGVSKGKSGGFRICYLDVPKNEKIYLIVIFPKNVQENLDKEEIKILKKLVERLKKEKNE